MVISRVLCGVLLALGLPGCENVLSPYRGPRPTTESISQEVAVVRYGRTPDKPSYIVDRMRFVEAGDPHDVNRVVWLYTTDATVDEVNALHLQPGDTITISTEYAGVREVGELTRVPNWPGHRYYEYPIATHRITAVKRVQ